MTGKLEINEEVIKKIISENLRALRKEKGLKQKSVSKQLKINNATLSHHENGENIPNLLNLIEYANFYGTSLDFICDVDINISNTDNAYKILTKYLTSKKEKDLYYERYGVLTLEICEPLIDYFKAEVNEYLHKRTSKIDNTAFNEILAKEKEVLFEIIKNSNSKFRDYVLIPVEDLKDRIDMIYPD